MENTEIKTDAGRYEVVKELGRGAMGTVFLGKDPRTNWSGGYRDAALRGD